MIICKICNIEIKNNNLLGKHLKKKHNITSEQYILKYKYNNISPTCMCGCGEKTNFVMHGVFDFANRIRGHKTQEERNFIKNKVEQTCLEKYGVSSTLLEKSTQQKIKNTIKNKYGVDNVSQSKEVQEIKKNNNIIKYGVSNPNKLKIIKDKIKKTCLERYGVDNYGKTQKAKDYLSNTLKFSHEEIKKICENKQYEPLFDYKDYKGCRDVLRFKCKIHNVEFDSQIFHIQQNTKQCPNCCGYNSSKGEKEIIDFIRRFYDQIITNSRSVISPYELDIYIPEKNIATEFNGLYWHSEDKVDKNYHFNKFQLCKDRGIRLLQFFEDEWRDKQDICKNIIKSNLGIINNKLDARKLFFKKIDNKEEIKNFLNNNHLQGHCRYNFAFGLYNNNELIQCITYRKPFTKKEDGTIEIARLCTKLDNNVRGGFSKLLKNSSLYLHEYKKIITYSDCLYSDGGVYEKNNFNFINYVGLNYYYTDFNCRFGRFIFRAQPGKTEKQVAEENKVCKIYGAGNYKWEIKL